MVLEKSDRAQHAAAAQEMPSGRPERPDLGDKLDKAQHLRIWHTKLGRSAYISQIELQRVLERAMRRAGLPLTFTGGYHPMPRMSFGRALPVGVLSAAEWFNVYLRRRMDTGEAAAALNAQMPAGLNVIGIEEIEMKKRRPQALFEDFLVRYSGEAAADAGRLWAEALESDSITAVRESDKKGRREIEVRPLIAGARELSPGVVKVRFDWREKYASPLAAAAAVAPRAGVPGLIKLRQWMEEPQRGP
jgi:radical SAM-linked protein